MASDLAILLAILSGHTLPYLLVTPLDSLVGLLNQFCRYWILESHINLNPSKSRPGDSLNPSREFTSFRVQLHIRVSELQAKVLRIVNKRPPTQLNLSVTPDQSH